ncbi:MAG: FAD-binding oxidoreductase [Candidatus Nanopelagicales bacterium]|nr:FAD-binding oxidoreductase [Candidatus Nanopelagicales bacterium]MCF8542181.1 FAD-binding oxidoreductase [Candidatus Nanopelagicales bacterium]MCF8557123.1 FAD-binding oxidoreductase [Candidatus Nanopelagicales bacterium]
MTDISRRALLGSAAVIAAATGLPAAPASASTGSTAAGAASGARWPAPAAWRSLDSQVGGRLIRTQLPWVNATPETFELLKNPFWNEEQPGALQSTGWYKAWTAVASPYAVRAQSTADIVAAVNFARDNDVKLVVKGTGHDYLGRNCAPRSLLVWTHDMRTITLHDAFLPKGAPAGTTPVEAMTVEAGTRWLEAYKAATDAGRFVAGGGCTSVGACGGFTFGSGFGPFSKRYGTGSGGIVQAEIVTADGKVHVVNEFSEPDLFFAVRGGGGSTYGIVSRVTLLMHPIPSTVGIITGSVTASSDAAYRELIQRFCEFYPVGLDNWHWGESVAFGPDNELGFRLTFLDMPEAEGRAVLEQFVGPLRERPEDFTVAPSIDFLDFKNLWNPEFWDEHDPDFITRDPRPGAPEHQFWWTGNQGELGSYWSGYQSRWIQTEDLRIRPAEIADAFFDASRLRSFIFQVNKGLSGEHEEARARDEQTALNPQCFGASALVLMGAAQQYRYPGVRGKEPSVPLARELADTVNDAMDIIKRATPGAGSYSTEADFFLEDWQEAQWGSNYARLLRIKRRYDPRNFFRVHHGVGSEQRKQ